MFEYVSTLEKAHEWHISQRRVTTLCKQGRIPGAYLMAKRWLIPVGAMKPEDPRTKEVKIYEVKDIATKEKLEAFEDADEIERELLRQGDIAINDIEGSEEE